MTDGEMPILKKSIKWTELYPDLSEVIKTMFVLRSKIVKVISSLMFGALIPKEKIVWVLMVGVELTHKPSVGNFTLFQFFRNSEINSNSIFIKNFIFIYLF
jgi:hypothetical protein